MAISTFSSLGAPITNAATGKPGKMAYRMAWIEYSEPAFVTNKTAKIVPNRNRFTSASLEWVVERKHSTAGQCERRRQSSRLNENLETVKRRRMLAYSGWREERMKSRRTVTLG